MTLFITQTDCLNIGARSMHDNYITFPKIMFFLVSISLFITTGCTSHYEQVSVPEYSGTIKVYPSSDTVSSYTEIPAGDYLVNDSQVYLSGSSDLSQRLGLLGIIIDRSRNAIKFEDGLETLGIKFNEVLADIYLNQSFDRVFELVDDKTSSDLILIPSAKLIVNSNNQALIEFRLAVKLIDPLTETQSTKNYYFFDRKVLPLTGSKSWSSEQGVNLLIYSRMALTNLTKAAMSDLFGNRKNYVDASKREYVFLNFPYSDNPIKSILLNKFDDFLVVANETNGAMVESTVLIVSTELLTASVTNSKNSIDIYGVKASTPEKGSWIAMAKTGYQSTFGSKGANENESHVVNVSIFQLPELSTEQDFLQHIVDSRASTPDTGRFDNLGYKEALSSLDGAVCVKYHSTSKDMNAKIAGGKSTMILESIGYNCQHPLKISVGVNIEYSSRHFADSKQTSLESDSKSLFESVQFTEF